MVGGLQIALQLLWWGWWWGVKERGECKLVFVRRKKRGGVLYVLEEAAKKKIKPTQTTGTATTHTRLGRFEIASTEGHWINGLEVTYVHHHEP
jgi:hypothetical protein